MIEMQQLPQLWEGCEMSLRSRCMRGTTRWRIPLSVPALVSDAGTSKWGQVAVTLHARSDSMGDTQICLTVRTLVVPTPKGCQDSQTLIRCLNQAKDCSDLLPLHRWKQLKLHVRKLKSTVMGERLPWMSSDPETANEEGYRLQVMKTSLRDQKYSFFQP
jgi:hypothetical protein